MINPELLTAEKRMLSIRPLDLYLWMHVRKRQVLYSVSRKGNYND